MSPEELFESNQKLVFFVVNKMKKNATIENIGIIDPEDMAQMGMIGLWKASEKFDINTGFKFSTYAIPAITGEIINSVRDNHGSIKVPRKSKQAAKLLKKRLENGQELPTVEEVQKEFGLSKIDSKIALELMDIKLVSTETPIRQFGNNREFSLADLLPDDVNILDDIIQNERIKEAFSALDNRELNIISLTIQGVRQTEIAKKMGISQVQVSRIYRKAIAKAKKHYEVINNENQPQFA